MREYICIYDEDDMEYIPNPYLNNDELIRCKDCKHFYPDVSACEYGALVTIKDFCSRAERIFVLRLGGKKNDR